MDYLFVAATAAIIGWFLGWRDTQPRENRLAQQARDLAEQSQSLHEWTHSLNEYRDHLYSYATARNDEYRRLLSQSAAMKEAFARDFLAGRKWLADAYAEYVTMQDAEVALSLLAKPNPAVRAAEKVREISASKAILARENRLLSYQLTSYEEYFPILLEYRDAILAEAVDLTSNAEAALSEGDAALTLGLLTREEYDQLLPGEKFQIALDRYWERNKSRVEIGRLYERYIGYLYESQGSVVRYEGALKGFEDFGRDLVCVQSEGVDIVQCKCWSRDKLVREKHIMQLFGTCILYQLTEGAPRVQPVFATTTELSSEASLVAEHLGVRVLHEPLRRYPMIKCNINPSTGERIYHLPFDQQYDRVLVGDHPGEFYAESVIEAEAAGFRRAYRWKGGMAV